ncbi:MAG: transposase [Desulfobacterales bacterium]|nr:transposase [Desulfobacterales bacterium]
MSVQNRRKYDPEFKRNAVRLSEEPGRTISEVAEGLGINGDLIYRWRRQLENSELAFPGHGKIALTQDQKRIRELEKKLKDTEMERREKGDVREILTFYLISAKNPPCQEKPE